MRPAARTIAGKRQPRQAPNSKHIPRTSGAPGIARAAGLVCTSTERFRHQPKARRMRFANDLDSDPGCRWNDTSRDLLTFSSVPPRSRARAHGTGIVVHFPSRESWEQLATEGKDRDGGTMAFRPQDIWVSLREMIRQQFAGKPESPFKSEQEAYEFVQRIYKETGGVTPELRRAYEFYLKNYHDDCPPIAGP